MWNNRSITAYFTAERRDVRAAQLFLRAVFVVTLFNVLQLWWVADVVLANYDQDTPQSWYARILMLPSALAEWNTTLFFIASSLFLILAIILKPDYRINIVFFWLCLNLFRIQHPVTNGSDFVVLALSIFAIPLATHPSFDRAWLQVVATALFNGSRVLLQIQIATIYFVSGWDKLKSPMWRSGDAFDYIAHLDLMFNPVFTPLFEYGAARWTMSWTTIVFELLFIPMVCWARARLFAILAGVVFHLLIWLMLGLPDFAWIMIASYPIFIKDDDLLRLKRKFRRGLP